MELLFDIETNGLLREQNGKPKFDRLHCIALKEPGDVHAPRLYYDQEFEGVRRDGTIAEGVQRLRRAHTLIGHDIQAFDLPALARLGYALTPNRIYDTRVVSRLIFPWIRSTDFGRLASGFPRGLMGSHSLRAWGWRLGIQKGEFEDFARLSPDMLVYCGQDVTVNERLYFLLLKQKWPERSLELEHAFSAIIDRQMVTGVGFDAAAAERLAGLVGERQEKHREGVQFQPLIKRWVTPKRKLERQKEVPVNPGSRAQVGRALIEQYDWKPLRYTDQGHPSLDGEGVESIPHTVPFRDDIIGFFEAQKVLGRLANGPKALLKNVTPCGDHTRIFHFVDHNGTLTGRCSHSVVANIPRVGSAWGQELRSLFVPAPGMTLVGADVAGIEARLMAHFLEPYDKGALIRRILEGDIHTQNQEMCGLASRQDAKNTLYAVGYGAQGRKVGIMNGVSSEEGWVIRSKMLAAVPGLERLVEDVKDMYRTRGWLYGLDGRRVKPRGDHEAFNTVIQSGGGVVMKVASRLRDAGMEERGYPASPDPLQADDPWRQVIHYHDEYECEVIPSMAETVGEVMVEAIVQAGEELDLKCPLDAEFKVGANWAEVH